MIVKPSIQWLLTVPDAELAKNAAVILFALTNNPNFPTPSPTLALIQAALEEFRYAMGEAAKGAKEATAVKNAKRAALISLLRALAGYLDIASGNDMAKLLSSKFPTQKPVRTPIGQLPQSEPAYLENGVVSGQIRASITPIYGAYTYNWRVALKSAPTVYVQTQQTTSASTVIEGLTPGQIYQVQVNTVGAAGTSDWSNPSELMAV